MALVKKTTSPAFEDQEINDNVDQAVDTPEAAAEAIPSAAAKVTATTAIAKAQTTSVGAVSKGFKTALTHLEYQLDLDTVRALGVGTLPKLTADRAGFEMGAGKDKQEFGDHVDFQIVSYNQRWLVTAGVEGDEGKEFLRTSYDGTSIEDSADTVQEYLAHLKEEGFSKAASRQYVDIYGFVLSSEKLGEVPLEERELIQMQLSPSSVKQFKGFQVKLGVTQSLTGKEASDVTRATIERQEYNGNKYASIKFAPA